MRVGLGYDSHRFVADRPLILAGQRIPHPLGLAGHSDADAVAHAVIDALLGATGLGDIGTLFPDTDPAWKDADSMELLRQVGARLSAGGWRPRQIDVTVVLEAPKLGPAKPAMAAALARALGLDADAVGVKAKTNEGMGFIGRGEGIAVLAVATVDRT
ncbi:MAG: 2-C-methyl-D-erythritol 2,4-cyclodiphosphate synthase [Gemmatimonadetes bacterium]|nr:2-C-methyl-D-erythritol 2,4-cyclodiphosphate synthase [Gemmatimonadota bacterium]MCC7134540.1 2-C-methyl-D-erythritol 2,4-cyclodiphosphate synthase [Gemmatimonadales bacterium]